MLLYLHGQPKELLYMPRQERKKSGTGIYHVMLRGINRQDVFEDEEDYLQMIACLQGIAERRDENGVPVEPLCILYAYCLMSNHLHLLVREQTEDISSVMKRLGIAYAYYFNKKYQRSGHLFQDRFRSEPVNTMEYFVTLLRYIHQNPVKAKIVPSPRDYLWSSFHEYSGTSTSLPRLCRTSSVTSRMNVGDLLKLID
jgi:REP element-mobilizing transposase RayT